VIEEACSEDESKSNDFAMLSVLDKVCSTKKRKFVKSLRWSRKSEDAGRLPSGMRWITGTRCSWTDLLPEAG